MKKFKLIMLILSTAFFFQCYTIIIKEQSGQMRYIIVDTPQYNTGNWGYGYYGYNPYNVYGYYPNYPYFGYRGYKPYKSYYTHTETQKKRSFTKRSVVTRTYKPFRQAQSQSKPSITRRTVARKPVKIIKSPTKTKVKKRVVKKRKKGGN